MKILCPKCKQEYEFSSEQNGQMFCCLECGEDFVIKQLVPKIIPRKIPEKQKTSKNIDSSATTISKNEMKLVLKIVGICVLSFIGIIIILMIFSSKTNQTQTIDQTAIIRKKFAEVNTAITDGDMVALTKLLRDANFEAEDENGYNLLDIGIHSGNREVVQMMLTCGAKVDKIKSNGETSIFEAVRKHNLPMLEFLVSKGADLTLNFSGSNHETILGIAAKNGFLDIVKYLCVKQDIIYEYDDSEKAIFLAIANKHFECAKVLLKKYDTETLDRNGNTILLAAVDGGDSEFLDLVIMKEANVEATNKLGETAFFLAVKNNNPAMIKKFFKTNINYNQTNKNGVSLPMLCIKTKNNELFKRCLTKENINFTDNEGRTALFLVCKNQNTEIFDLLMTKKASLKSRDFSVSPLRIAIENKNIYMVGKLLKAGIDANGTDQNGNNVLMLCAKGGDMNIMQLLLSKNTSLFDTNSEGKNAYSIATETGHTQIANLLNNKMDEIQLKQIKQQVAALGSSHGTTFEKIVEGVKKLKSQPDIRKQSANFLDGVLVYLDQQIIKRDNDKLNNAIAMARNEKNKSIDSAIKLLEDALKVPNKANNRSNAEKYLKELRNIKVKNDRIANMSQKELRTEINDFIYSWLYTMRRKGYTGGFWQYPSLAKDFFNVKKWEIFSDDNLRAFENTIIVNVESSNKAGMAISINWKVTIKRNDNMEWKIMNVAE